MDRCIVMHTFSSMVALGIAIMTIFGAAIDDKVRIMTALDFQWAYPVKHVHDLVVHCFVLAILATFEDSWGVFIHIRQVVITSSGAIRNGGKVGVMTSK